MIYCITLLVVEDQSKFQKKKFTLSKILKYT